MAGAKRTQKKPSKPAKSAKPVTTASAGSADKTPLLPESWVIALKNFGLSSSGVLLLALVGLVAFSLFDYNPLDPTWNAADETDVTNRLGAPGAILADILMQTLGLASWALLVPPLMWAQKIIRVKWLPHIWFNLAMVPIGVVMVALIFSVVPPHPDFAVQAGYGGALGQLLYGRIVTLMGGFIVPDWAFIGLFSVVGLPLFAASFGLRWAEWQAVGRFLWRGVRALGRSLKAAFVAGLRAFVARVERARTAHESDRDAHAFEHGERERAEPRLSPRTSGSEQQDDTPPWEEAAASSDSSVLNVPVTLPQNAPPVREKSKTTQGTREKKENQPKLPFGFGYQLPTLDLLTPAPPAGEIDGLSREALQQNALLLMETLGDFSVSGEIKDVRPGPVVTLYELEPAPGTKSSRVIGLADDIARSMSAISARIAVVPGRNRIGIELPNAGRETVYLRELLASTDYERSKAKLTVALGKDIGGAPVTVDLATMPHLLVAGTTGSGKSVGINTMILSLLYKHAPETLRLIMIDPKMLELSIYDGIPHLLSPVVTDPKKAVVALKWAVREMEDRYRKMSLLKVRTLAAFNKKVEEARAKGQTLTHRVQTGYDPETQEPIIEEEELNFDPLPYIVVIIDEMADLMIVAGKEVEATVQRLAQMARAAGIHLIMATQRPSVDVITGTIKANFPTRISFQVTSKIDSRTILNEQGAEQLLGRGDMLYLVPGARLMRVHGAFVDDGEVEDVVAHLKRQGRPDYVQEVTEEPPEGYDSPFIPGASEDGDDAAKSLYDQAVDVVLRDRKVSTSYIQRRLQIGYNKAATLIEEMEQNGVISAADHKNKREILVPERPEEAL